MLAFTFPGQGSQKPGMGAPWVDHESWELVAEASAIAGRDIARLLLEADAEELRQTRNAQLTTFVLSLVVLDAVERVGVSPGAAGARRLAKGDRRSHLAVSGCAGRVQHRRPTARRCRRAGRAVVCAAREPGAMAPERATSRRRRRDEADRARSRERAHRNGEAHRAER